jgi:hypothetical protein
MSEAGYRAGTVSPWAAPFAEPAVGGCGYGPFN